MRITVFLLTFLSFLSDLWAVDIPINITGTIIIPPCQINNSNPVDVDFGNIRVSELEEGANKQVISSQADSLIKISRIWADFFPANTSNQPI